MVEKELIVVAGPNGAGKSTFAKHLLREYRYAFHNADDIAASINPQNPHDVRISAGKIFLNRVRHSIEHNDCFVLESTLSGGYLLRILRAAREKQFRIRIVFVFLDGPEQSIERIQVRVRKGGHYVPDQIVRRRYYRSIINFWQRYRLLADEWQVFNNSQKDAIEVVVGEHEKYHIVHRDLFKDFLQDPGVSACR